MNSMTDPTSRETLLLVQKCAHTFSFYDLATGQPEKHIVLPNFPHEFTVDPVRKLAYVGHYGIETANHLGDMGGHSVFVIDLEAREHVDTLNLWPFYRPHGLHVDGQGRLFVMSEAHNTLLRFSDPLARQVPDLAVASGGHKTHLFALTRDAETAYALNLLSNTVTKIKPNDPAFQPVAVVPGPTPEGNVLSSDESLLYVANRGDDTIVAIDTATMKVVAGGKTRRDPNRVYRTTDSEGRDRLLATNSGEQSLSVFDTNLKERRCVELPANPLALSFHPTERAAFISFQDEKVRRLNLDTFEFEQQIATLREPDSSYAWIQ
ncbi:YncE family protein [Ramlibacter sp. WS9]|uniref:YncE family protein n=1 Tax=Ramlibacter sp. WS9 TaxID=1882741 RepID=UPI001E5A6679|nr:YncE family protein [Ramlibacter sp. WS9]